MNAPDMMTLPSEGVTAPGAAPDEWLHLDLLLGLTEDLLPVVSNLKAAISPNSAMQGVGKTPSTYNSNRQVVGFKSWTQYRASVDDITKWSAENDYSICIQTRRVRALDVDIDDPEQSRSVREFIGQRFQLPARTRGNAAKFLLAFDLPGEFYKRRIKTAQGVIEFLATGQQFVACGLHPSGARYEWAEGLPDAFPTLTAAEFEALWADLQAEFGVEEPSESKASTKAQKLADVVTNDPVAQHLLEQGLVRRSERDGRLHIVCPWEDEHTSNTGDSSTTYWPAHTGGFPHGGFKCMHAHCEHRTVADLKDAIGYADESLLSEFAAIEIAVSADEHVEPCGREGEGSMDFPAAFRGAMSAAVDAALEVAIKPQPEISTLSALLGMAASIPGAYSLPSGMRLNLFGCSIAGTGEGKDMPRRIAINLVNASGGEVLGRPASGQGLEDALQPKTGTLVEVDEIAHLFAAMNGSKAPPHLIELSGAFLRLFSASGETYRTRRKARTTSVAPPRTISNPVVSLLGYATPEKLGEALSAGNIEDGLLGRFLFAWGRSNVAPRRISAAFDLPEDVEEKARLLNSHEMFADENGHITIGIHPEADAYLDGMLSRMEHRRNTSSSPFARALLARSFEKAQRVAGVLAVWDDPGRPQITIEHVEWAERYLAASDTAIIKFTADYMHGGQVQADADLVLRTLKRVLKGEFAAQRGNEAGFIAEGVAPWSTVLRASKLEKRRMDDAVAHLRDLDEVSIEVGKVTHARRGVLKVNLLRLRG